MKNHFINLFNYDKHTNLQILYGIFETDQPEQAVRLMAHVLGAQQVWLSRCKQDNATGLMIWPDWQAVQLKYIIEENHAAWLEFVNNLTTEDFDKSVSYTTTKGVPYTDKLINILSHVINHGTHHRAQIGQQLKQAGLAQLPSTDYIFYVRH
ncbi:DinB family protein [Mucilaginibacter terrae]|uniref:Damage-inducible protein DinB n=1 Tax=Mucilaginibacter terrae TaxID=1955052 RepID=A0ABU3H386_9SPHI|nr:DinB family protein [Mucilaginibacter terrae]MDT3405682.1 putative damage-inducible protein DinB [Mucilaginibacter terrae]